MSAATPLTDPPALNSAYPDFPYRISPFPLNWLIQFTNLSKITPPEIPSANSTSNSLESWT